MMESHTSGKQDHSPSVCTSQAVEAYKGFSRTATEALRSALDASSEHSFPRELRVAP